MPVFVDIIILSFGKTKELQDVTDQTVQSLLQSEDPAAIQFNIVVVESNRELKPHQYPGTKTLYPNSAFGFHKYMNIGLRQGNNEYICLCNNDLIFYKNWASELIKAMKDDPDLLTVSPYDENFHTREGFVKNTPPVEGYLDVLSGWCIFAKRRIFDIIGELDEHLIFWYCDADYCQSLIKHNLKHCLVPSSLVTHLGSTSLRTVDAKERERLTKGPRLYYDYKWQHNSWLKYKWNLLSYKLHKLINK